jgi:hypothetical protein
MNTYYTFLFLAFIVLFLNSSLSYRISSYPHEEDEERVSIREVMMAVPNKGDFTGGQYVLSPFYPVPDRKLFILVCFIQLSRLVNFM